MKRIALVLIVGLSATVGQADEFDVVDYGIFRSIDPLAQRDEWGVVHQGRSVNATDFAPRYHWRWVYYFKEREQLLLIQLMWGRCRPRCAGWATTAVPLTACLPRQ